MLQILQPDFFLQNLLQVSSTWLQVRNFQGLILDVDNTFVSRDAALPSVIYGEWLEKLQAGGIRVILLSNNGGSRAEGIAARAGVPVQTWAAKPLPSAFKQAGVSLGLPRAQILVIGDQLFTDILGAHLAGFKAALVKPLPGTDFLLTHGMRTLEKYVFQYWRKTGVPTSWEEDSL